MHLLMSKNIVMLVEYFPVVNFSMQQNHVPVVRSITLTNKGEGAVENLRIVIDSDPAFAEQATIVVDTLSAGEERKLTPVKIDVSTSYMSNLTERVDGSIIVRLLCGEEELEVQRHPIALLAFDQWSGSGILPEMLAAFVTPNQPEIVPIVKRASEILERWTGSPSLNAYQSRDPDMVKKQMAAIYEAIAERQIAYCVPPASFEAMGQRIRLYEEMLGGGLGTCLEMTLLYAGCLESVGLHPILVLVEGHAFAGAWLVSDTFADSVNDDASLLSKRVADGINEILVVETTCMNAGSNVSFDAAAANAAERLRDVEHFEMFIDVVRARLAQIRPLPRRVARDGIFEISEETPADRDVSAPTALSATEIVTDVSHIEIGKQSLWERKLLDLSLRNNLLNMRMSKSVIQLISVRLNELEDALADGREFKILNRPTDWDNPLMDAGIYEQINGSHPMMELVASEFDHGRLRTYLKEDEIHGALGHLYRSSRVALEENGANTLFLALGLLKWFETAQSTRPRFAPIILLPVEIVRKVASKSYIIRSRDEDAIINVTLLEMLRQYFGITIGGLDTLPRDESGVDVQKIFNIVRRAVMSRPGWDVEEQAFVGNFSFSKFIMWNDIHNNADKLCRNKIVASLMSGKMEWSEPDDDAAASADLDRRFPAGEIALPIGADSSQLEAIGASTDGRSFILHGPPGTGKSQTITNIIANALYRGRRVLFVAEKMAALQVVQRRLEAIGLAPFCLELHSNKTKKANVMAQLKRTTEVVRRKSGEEFALQADQINQLRRELNGYVDALHRLHPAGLSLYDCVSRYSGIPYDGPTVALAPSTLDAATSRTLAEMEGAIDDFQTICTICSPLADNPLADLKLTSYSARETDRAARMLTDLTAQLKELTKLTAALESIFGIELLTLTPKQADALLELTHTLLQAKSLPWQLIENVRRKEMFDNIREAVNVGNERNALRDELSADYLDSLLLADVGALKAKWSESLGKWWLPRTLGQNAVRSQLKRFSRTGRKPDAEIVASLLDRVELYQSKQSRVETLLGAVAADGGPRWNADSADWAMIADAADQAELVGRLVRRLAQEPSDAHTLIKKLSYRLEPGVEEFRDSCGDALKAYGQCCREAECQIAEVVEMLCVELPESPEGGRYQWLAGSADRWLKNLPMLHDRAAYNQQRAKVAELGLTEFVEAVEGGDIAPADVTKAFSKSFYRSYANLILDREPPLSTFHGLLFEKKIERLKEMSAKLRKLTRDELYARLASTLPAFQKEASMSSEVGILQRNIANGARGTSIRKLFDQIPDLFGRICPCMLMSPISVAQYLDPARTPFDLVIFDEASQMPTSEAVGAIARGRNVIVVGDPKQMPPTNFFSTNTFDESNADKEDLESILDDCLALSLPSRHLLWHYRSKHESLIAFSNANYYDNKLLTFPSPDDLVTRVGWQYVEGRYDRGRSRQNRAEAEAVVEEIRSRLSDPSRRDRSIGVVTFNTNQQSLIEDLLTDMLRQYPELEALALESEEPVFVKNLENVQGDERDVILFSIGFGPDKEGRIALNFGPLNRDGGWRRLNVAVSRARYEMKVFSSLRADQIDLNRTSAEGVAGLKAFLDYAEKGRGVLAAPAASGGNEADALIRSLADELSAMGHRVRTNIGCSGYRIDIGIVDPANPDRYLLGLLLDGENYLSARTSADRNITQPSVLCLLGWRIFRIWSLDLWENRRRVIENIVAAIEKARTERTTPPEPPVAPPAEQSEPESDQSAPAPTPDTAEPEPDSAAEPYVEAHLPQERLSADEFLAPHHADNIRQRISAVISAEAPISRSLLCRKIINSFGISRMGTRIAQHLDHLISDLQPTASGPADAIFYWRRDQTPELYDRYRPQSSREALDIAPEEVAAAICRLLDDQGGIEEEALPREAARIFGFSRMGDNVAASMQRAIAHSLATGQITLAAGRYRRPQR